MKSFLFYGILVALGSVIAVKAAGEHDYDDYDVNYDYDFLKEEQKSLQAEMDKLSEMILVDEGKDKDLAAELDNYLYEDNRDPDQENKEEIDSDDGFEDNIETIDSAEDAKNSQQDNARKTEDKDSDETVFDVLEPDSKEEPKLPPPIVEDEKKIFLEAQEILNEDEKEVNDFEEEKPDVNLEVKSQENIQDTIDETKRILTEDGSFEDSDPKSEDDETINEENLRDWDKLDDHLKLLMDTMDKLTENDTKEDDYEDYEQIDDSNLSDIFADHVEDIVDSGERFDSEPNADDDLNPASEKSKPIMYQNDALEAGEKADSSEVEVFSGSTKSLPTTKSEEIVQVSPVTSSTQRATTEEIERQTKMVDALSSSEFDQIMKQFSILHSEDLDVKSSGFARDVAPIHIKLSLDEPVVITSPNYPRPYPTNNIIDWILEGTDGMGIEFNVTDFAVNGALGDYVLVKPGGVDASGTDGLIFSYRLTSERRYRFSDVNKMFIRFEARVGMMFLRGFSFSVKLMTPLRRAGDQEDPESEAVLAPPAATLKVFLAVSPAQFLKIKDDFRELVADMSTSYIKDNNIDPGLNRTFETTQLTGQSVCNIHWPGFDSCVEVTFGVPLQYKDSEEYRLNAEDLIAMWSEYTLKEPYASRLKEMGITEFSIPDDDSILMLWLVIAAGVVIAVALLAFVLWRFSCFEDYTRMKTYSDTDSLKSGKRDLDLYPTPHQTLPPLYTENDYKWPDVKYDNTATVNMGGFANRNYLQDDIYDFDSDEEVTNKRDRYCVVGSKDGYSNV